MERGGQLFVWLECRCSWERLGPAYHVRDMIFSYILENMELYSNI